jgi:hypothetical protein
MENLLETILERIVIGIVGMIMVLALKVFQLKLNNYMILWGISTVGRTTIFSNLFNWGAFLITLPLMTYMFYSLHKEPSNFPTDGMSQSSTRIHGIIGATSHFVTVGLLWFIVSAIFSKMDSN